MCRNDLTKPFQPQYRGPVKLLQPSLSVMEDLKASFHHCGSHVKLIQACVCVERSDKVVSTAEKVL